MECWQYLSCIRVVLPVNSLRLIIEVLALNEVQRISF